MEKILPVSQRELIFDLMFKKSGRRGWAEWLRAPLEHACEAGDSALVDALLEAGADRGGRGLGASGRRTLLHAAAAGGSESVVWSLLGAGSKADMEVLSGDDGDDGGGSEWCLPDTPLRVAVKKGHGAAARALVAAGADTAHAVALAIDGGHERLACDLLLAGADPDQPGLVGWSLMHACRLGCERLVRALLQKKEEEEEEEEEEESYASAMMGHTPLHEAASGGHAGVARVLLAAGWDPAASTWQGETPLHAAARSGSAATIDVLVAAGADVEARHATLGQGRRPLHVAAENGRAGAALALLQRHGADVHAVDHSGLQPLHLACARRPRAETVGLLLRWGADETAVVAGDGRTPADLLPTLENIELYVDATYAMEEEEEDGATAAAAAAREGYRRQELDNRDRVAGLLNRAPNDRAWRRRGFAVLCRARAEALRLEAAAGTAAAVSSDGRAAAAAAIVGTAGYGKLARRENAGGVGGSRGGAAARSEGAPGEGGTGLAAWLVDLQEEGVFRNIVVFL